MLLRPPTSTLTDTLFPYTTLFRSDRVRAVDTGPGNALINDWVEQHGLEPLDRDGALAAAGRVDAAILAGLLDNPYFERRPPKSLDRDDFTGAAVAGLALEDGAATLTAFTRSEERRVGKECVSTCRSRWSPYH